jgi:hypothetical protein
MILISYLIHFVDCLAFIRLFSEGSVTLYPVTDHSYFPHKTQPVSCGLDNRISLIIAILLRSDDHAETCAYQSQGIKMGRETGWGGDLMAGQVCV